MRASIAVAEADVALAHATVASHAAQAAEAKADAVATRARARRTEAFEAIYPRPANAAVIASDGRHATWLDEQVRFHETEHAKATARLAKCIEALATERRRYREDLAFARRVRNILKAG